MITKYLKPIHINISAMASATSNKKQSKIKLSENMQMGIAAPTSQGTFFKVGGALFLVLSVIVAGNMFHMLGSEPKQNTASQSQSVQQQVLGAYTQNTAQVQTTTYTVQKGDTLFDISQSHGVSWQVIAALNNLSQPYTLKAGTQLKIPVPQQ